MEIKPAIETPAATPDVKADKSTTAPNAPAQAPETPGGQQPEKTLTPESAPAAPVVTPEQFQALAKTEYELQQTKREHKELLARLSEMEKAQEAWKADPYAALEQYGGSMEHYARRILNDGQPSREEKETQIEKELREMKEWRAQLEQHNLQSQRQKEIRDYVAEMGEILRGEQYKPADYMLGILEPLQGVGRDEILPAAVDAHIQRVAKETGRVLTPAQAADILLDESKTTLDRLIQSILSNEGLKTYFLDRLGPQDRPAVPAREPSQRQTLTSDDETKSPPIDESKLSHDDRLRLMAEKLKAAQAASVATE